MRIRGLIYSFDIDKQTITIKYKKRLESFYFQRGLFKNFKSFLTNGEIIDLFCYDEKILKNKQYVYQVMYINELTLITRNTKKVFYDKHLIKKSIKEFFEGLNYRLFIDTEMTMPGYKNDKFLAELIQAGFFVVDKNNNIIEEYNFHIRPSIAKYINKRTKEFLHLSKDIKKEEVSYYKFYNKFKSVINKYRPAIITFGKNDQLYLESSFKVNALPEIPNLRFVNLAHIIKNYYNLQFDPGLFSLYEKFYNVERYQTHDALDDALVLKDVYDAFLKDIKGENDESK